VSRALVHGESFWQGMNRPRVASTYCIHCDAPLFGPRLLAAREAAGVVGTSTCTGTKACIAALNFIRSGTWTQYGSIQTAAEYPDAKDEAPVDLRVLARRGR
jgi:hypothetical protein